MTTHDPRLDYADEATRQRVNRGAQRAQTQLDLFYDVMAHELELNCHKGDPTEQSALTHVAELFYHAAKLYMALRFGQRKAALEYAADCGNHAWMAAESAHVLDLDLLTGGLEGRDQSDELYDGKTPDVAQIDPEQLERLLREQPWIFPAELGGFYGALKDFASTINKNIDHVLEGEQSRAMRRCPERREALGEKR